MRPSDYLVMGWTEAQITAAILRQAAASGDLTRAGVERAAFTLEQVDFGGLAPAQSWKGDADDSMVRQSYTFKPKLSRYREGPLGAGHTGNELLAGPFSSPITDEYDYAARGACFKPAG